MEKQGQFFKVGDKVIVEDDGIRYDAILEQPWMEVYPERFMLAVVINPEKYSYPKLSSKWISEDGREIVYKYSKLEKALL